jgi:hypothetical protein
MRPRKGSRVRHAEQQGRRGTILRRCELWDAEARHWEPAAWVAFDGDGIDSLVPLRDLVLVRRGGRDERAAGGGLGRWTNRG